MHGTVVIPILLARPKSEDMFSSYCSKEHELKI